MKRHKHKRCQMVARWQTARVLVVNRRKGFLRLRVGNGSYFKVPLPLLKFHAWGDRMPRANETVWVFASQHRLYNPMYSQYVMDVYRSIRIEVYIVDPKPADPKAA
jgi:hypothetical protein